MTDHPIELRCETTDMITYACPCPVHRNIKDDKPTDGLLIDMFIESARFGGPCTVNPDHVIEVGTRIARVAEDGHPPRTLGYCCAECRTAVEKYWEDQV